MMGWRIPEQGWTKGPWTHDEDQLLSEYVKLHGEGRWSSVARCTGLKRSAKSCRLRWVNYLRPGLKKGQLTPLEEGIIIELHALLGNKWSTIARYLPGRTDNEIKNYWRTHFKKREKGKAPVLKQKSAPQRQEQQLQEDDMGRTTYADPSGEQGTKKENFYSMYPTFELEDQSLSMMCQDVASWLDTIREDDLCGGLWNLEDLEGDITDMDQPPTGFSCGVDSNNVDDGEYIKFLEG